MNQERRSTIWNGFTAIIQELLSDQGVDAEDILPTSTAEELGMSSIDIMDLMVMLEDRFGWRLDFQRLMDDPDTENPIAVPIVELFNKLYSMGEGNPEQA